MARSNPEETVTINAQPFLMPLALVVSSLIFGLCFLAGFIHLGNSIQKMTISGGTATAAATTTTSTQAGATTTATVSQLKDMFNSGKYITFGDVNSKVLFTEVSDPSCPYCHIAAGHNGALNKQAGAQFTLVADGGSYVAPVIEMKKLVDAGQAAFMWLYSNGHGNGEVATRALYCAKDQGKFWEAHDKMMTAEGYDLINNTIKNDKSKNDQMADFLNGLVDVNALKGCLASNKYDGKPAEDQTAARAIGVSGTPGFFINAVNFAGAYSYVDMKSTVDGFLNQ